MSGPVLMPVFEYGEFRELRRVARDVGGRLGAPVLFHFTSAGYRRLVEDTRELVEEGHAWIDGDGAVQTRPAAANPVTVAAAPGGGRRFSRRLRASHRALARGAVDAALTLRAFRDVRARLRRAERILAKSRPSVLVLGQDAVGTDLSFLLRAAKRRGIPGVIVPFATFNMKANREYAMTRPELQVGASPSSRIAARLFPHWVADCDGRRLIRLPGPEILALEAAGLGWRSPWVPCAGDAKAIAVESEAKLRAYRGMGFADALLHVTGSPVHDVLAAVCRDRAERRAALMRRHGLDERKPLLLCAWPPNQIWPHRPCPGFRDYDEIGTFWSRALRRVAAAGEVNVVVKTHPKMTAAERAVAVSSGLPIAEDDTAELLPLCDLLVTIPSSVTAWAIALGIPVLEYDLYHYAYPDFVGVEGVVAAADAVAFEALLGRVTGDPGYRAALAAAQRSAAADWGRIDGRARERVADLVAAIAKEGAA